MAVTMEDPDNIASPEAVLSALRVLLLPKPRLSNLPTVLELLAHIQLVRLRITEEARHVLALQEEARQLLENEGRPASQHVRLGLLSQDEGKKVARWASHEDGDLLAEVSLQLRRYHIAMLASHPQASAVNIRHLLNTVYFPNLEHGTTNARTYIRHMPQQLNQLYDNIAAECLDWLRLVREANESQSPRPSMKRMLGDSRGESIVLLLVQKALEEVRYVIQDAENFHNIFQPNDSNGRASPVKPSVTKREPINVTPMDQVAARQDADPDEPRPKLEHLTPRVAPISAYLHHGAAITEEQSMPVDAEALPHVHFSRDRNGSTRMSVDRQGTRSPTLALKHSPHESSGLQRVRSRHTSISHQSNNERPHSSERKEPRRSSGMMSEVGPDYTKALPTRKSQSDMRPFDTAQMKRGRGSLGSSGRRPKAKRPRPESSRSSDASNSDY